MKNDLAKTIGLRVQTMRKQCGFTQEQLADQIEKTVETVSNIERGVKLPGLLTLYAVSEALDVELSVLIGNMKKRSRKHQALHAEVISIIDQMNEKDLLKLSRQYAFLPNDV